MAPVSGRIGDLANRMDPLADYLAEREQDPAFTGFHRIEYGLWAQDSTDGLGAGRRRSSPPTRRRCKDRLKDARRRARPTSPATPPTSPARVADQATGSQAPYSHADLAEFSADLDGIAKSALLVDPLVARGRSRRLGRRSQTALDRPRATLDGFEDGRRLPVLRQRRRRRPQRRSPRPSPPSPTAAAALNPAIGLE